MSEYQNTTLTIRSASVLHNLYLGYIAIFKGCAKHAVVISTTIVK